MVLAAACGARGGSPPAPDSGALALVVRGDTTVLEEFVRTGSSLEGTVVPRVRGARFGWARYRVEFGRGGAPVRAELHLGRAGTALGSEASSSWRVEIRDGVLEEQPPHGAPQRHSVPRGVVPVFAPSMAMHHEVIRQALLRGGRRTAEVAVYQLAGDGPVGTASVSWFDGETAMVAYPAGSPAVRFRVGARGRVLGSETPDGEFRSVRLR
jgi:hypothetical protein